MIRTVTVYTGDSDCAQAAQQHAIALAKHVSARLKIVGLGDAKQGFRDGSSTESVADLMQRKRASLAETAERAGVRVVSDVRGNGLKRGLLEEARETDVLVLGLPTEADMASDDAATHLVRKERPVLRKAHCALLLVNQPPVPVKRILACYDDEPVGQRMLQMAGSIAEAYQARIGVFANENDLAKARELADAAKAYLEGYDVPAIDTIAVSRPKGSRVEILHAAESFEADLITMGEEGHNWLERMFCKNVAERTAMATPVPLLIAR